MKLVQGAYEFTGAETGEIEARFAWKPRPEWLSRESFTADELRLAESSGMQDFERFPVPYNLHVESNYGYEGNLGWREEKASADAVTAAKALVGTWLCRRLEDGSVVRRHITETEAYCGEEDTACHAHKGRTARTDVMYAPGGCAYIYLCYGMHEMLNVVTGAEGRPEAVLIRGVESAGTDPKNPVCGISAWASCGYGGDIVRVRRRHRAGTV